MSNQQQFYNNAQADLISAVGTGDTIFTIGNGEVANFPSILTGGNYFLMTLSDNNIQLSVRETAWEIVRVTAISNVGANKQLSCVRGQEGTTAVAWGVGTLVSVRNTAASMNAAFSSPPLDSILTDGNLVLLDGAGNVLFSG